MLVGADELKSLEERVNERIDSLVIQLSSNISADIPRDMDDLRAKQTSFTTTGWFKITS